MNDFIQMDIFFFITSVVALVLLFFLIIVGTYAILVFRRMQKMTKDLQTLVEIVTKQGAESMELIKQKVENMSSRTSIFERVITSTMASVLARTSRSRGKIKTDARKKK